MVKPVLISLSQITPMLIQQYERYLPTAFDESLTILQKINKVIQYMNQIGDLTSDMLEKWNEIYEWVLNDGLKEEVEAKLTEWLNDGTLSDFFDDIILGGKVDQTVFDAFKQETENITKRIEPIGTMAVKLNDSAYIPNDANFFGYLPDGQLINGLNHLNLATVQQNSLIQYGDVNAPNVWIVSNGYMSLRAPNTPSFQLLNEDGTPKDAGRTFRHQGNSSYHLRVYNEGDQTLVEDVYNSLNNLSNVQGVFPSNGYSGSSYIIPREGMYTFNLQLKIKTPPLANGYIRVAIEYTLNGVTSISDIEDVYYQPSVYGTPFLNSKFDWKFSKDAIVKIKVKPLNENIVIENGTRLQIYFLGDTIQA